MGKEDFSGISGSVLGWSIGLDFAFVFLYQAMQDPMSPSQLILWAVFSWCVPDASGSSDLSSLPQQDPPSFS